MQWNYRIRKTTFRYQDIRCLDSTRVILQNRSNDYIHANWINSADGRRFICAQGPMEGTVGDFWEMLVQEGCRTIIMLCALIEGWRTCSTEKRLSSIQEKCDVPVL
ncbi:unnamed protein product [Heligmosomoides polygyrus]|uniref:Tyrosine-protein phosphatase domain-containing protein n=1 Tax=Heligmosomoides polygyrus TaxID=6339 RepID=A0A3P7TQ59_HELPZ|nr:unnamed protein product [Heligmosomoides polygyrus]